MQREQRRKSATQALNLLLIWLHGFIQQVFACFTEMRKSDLLFKPRVHPTRCSLYRIVVKKKENPKGLCGGWPGLKVNCTLIEAEMKAGVPLKMSIRHARQWKPSMETVTSSSLPSDFCPNTELTTGHHQSRVCPELHRALC